MGVLPKKVNEDINCNIVTEIIPKSDDTTLKVTSAFANGNIKESGSSDVDIQEVI